MPRLAPYILPVTAVMEMTYRCNHGCVFCSCPWFARNGTSGVEMPAAEWRELIQTYADAGVVNFCFTGGEALMKDGILELIDFAATVPARWLEMRDGTLDEWQAPPRVYLLSNGRLVDEDVLQLCQRHGVALSVSLPGLETFDAHTGGSDGPGYVLQIFRRAAELGVATTAGITVTRKNFHELYETISVALLAGADNILLNRFMPGGRGLDATDWLLTYDQAIRIPLIADDVLRKACRPGSIGTEYPRCALDPAACSTLKTGTRCSAATGFFVVGPSGQLRVCNHSPVELVHWRDFDNLRHHPYWKTFVHKTWTPRGCEGCSKLGTECDGGCREAAHVANGDVNAPDPMFDAHPAIPFIPA